MADLVGFAVAGGGGVRTWSKARTCPAPTLAIPGGGGGMWTGERCTCRAWGERSSGKWSQPEGGESDMQSTCVLS